MFVPSMCARMQRNRRWSFQPRRREWRGVQRIVAVQPRRRKNDPTHQKRMDSTVHGKTEPQHPVPTNGILHPPLLLFPIARTANDFFLPFRSLEKDRCTAPLCAIQCRGYTGITCVSMRAAWKRESAMHWFLSYSTTVRRHPCTSRGAVPPMPSSSVVSWPDSFVSRLLPLAIACRQPPFRLLPPPFFPRGTRKKYPFGPSSSARLNTARMVYCPIRRKERLRC